jgi:hypothetical protein
LEKLFPQRTGKGKKGGHANKREKNIPDRREQKILQMLRGRGLLGMSWIFKEGECGQRKEPTLYCYL